ncbi:MAG: serine hydrolase [Leptolyngbyaceae cyanobacterium]
MFDYLLTALPTAIALLMPVGNDLLSAHVHIPISQFQSGAPVPPFAVTAIAPPQNIRMPRSTPQTIGQNSELPQSFTKMNPTQNAEVSSLKEHSAICPVQRHEQLTLMTEMNTYLQAHYETGRFMGTAIVACGGKTVFVKGYGMASLEHQVPNVVQTKFRIGSITKQFTAAAILQLQDQGLLDVQASVATYLPDYPNGDTAEATLRDRITIHHLLTHTAGIPNLTSFPDYLEWMRQPTTLGELVAHFQDLPLEFEPGQQYRYSNSGYVLLTQVIETVSGQSYADYLQKHLLLPLGLENTGYEQPLSVIDGLANGYRFMGEDYQQAEYINMAVPAGAGALYSTVDDLVRWQQFLMSADERPAGILSNAAITAMKTPHVAMGEAAPDLSYGYGLVVGKPNVISHGGGINGFVTYLGSLPDRGLTVAVLSNVENANPQDIGEGLLAILQGQPYELPSTEAAVAIDLGVLQRYIGTYQVTPEFQVTITVESEQLHIQGTGQPKIPLYPASTTEFFARMLEFRIVFNTDPDGTVESATLLQNGQELPAPKVD